MQYDNLKLQTFIKVSPRTPKVYGNHCLLNNIKPTHLKGKNEFAMHALIFIAQRNLATKTILSFHKWQLKRFGRPKNDDWKVLVIAYLVIKIFL
jgi:hypothetical protein